MDYITVYKYSPDFQIIYPLIFSAGLFSGSIFFLISLKKWMVLNKFYSWIFKFVAFWGALFSSIFLIISLIGFVYQLFQYVKITRAIRTEKYELVEGQVYDYEVKKIDDEYYECFKLGDHSFKNSTMYSDSTFLTDDKLKFKGIDTLKNIHLTYMITKGEKIILKITR